MSRAPLLAFFTVILFSCLAAAQSPSDIIALLQRSYNPDVHVTAESAEPDFLDICAKTALKQFG